MQNSTVVLASGNVGKLKELSELLAPLGWQVASQKNFFDEEVEETGLTFIENAILKAHYAAQKTGLPAIADDSGLEVDALQGRPGIYSARYAALGDGNASDADNITKLLAEMQGQTQRKACYYSAMAFVRFAEDPTPLIGLGRWCGEVLEAPQGTGGFGYDPVIWMPEFGCSVANLAPEQKNKVSHRALALAQLVAQLKAELIL
ncbi:RdgB/HAM1 family non-canonical purine NTP pyrophosphatase [Thiosulfativibrio zosterae]|uniref:dITP/XTP pyrophosphatase n=1 Tax=Thiosulfativibrio zosterae TaxID=2675053 RepID=A0A6F8PQP8_9GAMM|nr:RdgB/HAM1 family non-canonical purine NTP pyrophosphatase [Thiosulfativibrio zosterae]BBP44364.1 non-canonical purine NTP pyrophosphatase [Thiosulfativibrio zosterae]